MTKDIFAKQMKTVMNIAWGLVRVNNYTMSEALKQSWNLFRVRQAMRKDAVQIQYRKKDGTVRKALATTCPELIPDQVYRKSAGGLGHTNMQFRYFDVEKNDWRSFIVANLI